MTARPWIACMIMAGGLTVANGQTDLADQIRIAQRAGDYSRAARLYRELIASGTDTPEVRTNYGVMLHLAGENQEALRQLETALHRNPSLANANLVAGLTAFDLREYQKAETYLVRAQSADPQASTPALALAKTQMALKDFRSANAAYRRVAQIEPNSAEAWFGIGVTDRALADASLNQAARRGNLASVQAASQRLLRDALDALTRALAIDPNSARAHLLRAETLSDQGNLPESVAEYEAALKINPQMDGARLGLATTYWKNRHFDEARPLLQQVLRSNPSDPEANGIMADILQHDGENAAAQKYAETALRQNPNLIETRLVLARIHLAQNQPRQAIVELDKIAPADSDGNYHFLLYRAYHLAGDEKAAQAALAEYKRRHELSSH